MRALKTITFLFIAGALGGFTSGVLVWICGKTGITPTLGFNFTPEMTLEWIARRSFASGIWGFIFLIPVYNHAPLIKGALLGIPPWLSSLFYIFPYKMHMGFFGLGLGWGTPLWTLFFGFIWGATGTLFLAKFYPNLKFR